jgi:putative transcriptional regulator
MKTLQGHLLIAPPQERDLDFIRTVILLIQHSEEQAFGVVLNRPSTTTVRQAWRGGGGLRRDDEFVYSGGPVSGPLMALHTDPSLGEIEVLPGVYYSVKKRRLKELFDAKKHPMKVFQSHVGWGPDQLVRFLDDGPWRILPAAAEIVFSVGTNLWEEVSKLANELS